MVKVISDLIGDQTPTADIKELAVYFMTPVIGANGNTVSFEMQRVVCSRVRNYYSVDEILEDQVALPLNKNNYSIQMLKKHIAMDARRGFGFEIQGYPLVAYCGASVYEKPIALVREGGTSRYILNPNFSNMVKRT